MAQVIEIARFLITTNPGFYDRDADAIMEGSLQCIRTIDGASITILSRRPDYDTDRHDARVAGINYKELNIFGRAIQKIKYPEYFLLALWYRMTGKYLSSDRLVVENRMWNEYCDADVIVTGLDDSFSSNYGTISLFMSFYNVMLWKMLGKKVVMLGGSVGMFRGIVSRMMGRHALDKLDLITLREPLSYDYLRSMGVKNGNVHVTADPTFLIDAAQEGRIEEMMKAEGISRDGKPLIGVSISRVVLKWMSGSSAAGHKINSTRLGILRNVLDDLIEKTGATIVFLPCVFGPCDFYDDRIFLDYFRNGMKNKDRTLIVKNECSPGELRGLIGKCDLFIGTRPQTLISSAMMRVPFVAIDNESFETKGIFGKMLHCEDYIIDVRDIDHDQLLNKILNAWTNREFTKSMLEQKTADMIYIAKQNTSLLKSILI